MRGTGPVESRRFVWTIGLVLVLSASFLTVESLAQEPAKDSAKEAEQGTTMALLIGVEKYHRATPLRFTVNDVKRLGDTMRQRGGVAADKILELSDAAANPRYQPLRTSILTEIPRWLEQAQARDTVILYFSGHGVRDGEGKLYLAPIDCDPADPVKTGVSVQWLREQLSGCKSKFKLLILDSCHAGSEKGEDLTVRAAAARAGLQVSARDLGETFRDLENVVTLASSTADEKSQIWEEKQQSLFSYWLVQGLKGHADEDGNAEVDIDELYKYVFRCVTQSAKARFPRPQSPVRIVRSGTLDVPTVVRLRPLGLRPILADMAEQLSWGISERKLAGAGVLEFSNDTKLGELLGADFGLLGKYCAEELERRLLEQANGSFRVVDRDRLKAALKTQELTIDSLAAGTAVEELARRVGGMPALVRGTLSGRQGRKVNLRCRLLQTTGDELLVSVGGTAWLNESEWAMLGRSAQVRPEDRRPTTNAAPQQEETSQNDVAVQNQVVARLDERSEGAHPLLDPKFPYRVKFMVGGKERKGAFRGNELFIPVRKGEVYEIWVENHSGQKVFMRLLVDGLNTLPEPSGTKGVVAYEIAQRVNLDSARAWLLNPADQAVRIQGIPTWAVRGFVSSTGVQGQGKLREFLVVDVEKSLAARRKYTDQIGLVTAAFYAPAASSRRVGTGLGNERVEEIREVKDGQAGNLLAVIHVRYVDADTINGASK